MIIVLSENITEKQLKNGLPFLPKEINYVDYIIPSDH
jgi:hypothetical protein